MATIAGVVENAVQEYIDSEAGRTYIETAAKKLVNQAVDNATGYSSPLRKSVDEAVEKSLGIRGEIDLPSYNDTLLKIIAAQVDACTKDTIQKQVEGRIRELLKPAPESIKLSELVQSYIEHLRKQNESGCVCYGDRSRATFVLTEPREGGFRNICLDSEPSVEPRKCAIRLGWYRDEIYHLHFQNQDIEKQMFAGPFYGFERTIFQMKAAKTKVIIDEDELEYVDLNYGHHE